MRAAAARSRTLPSGCLGWWAERGSPRPQLRLLRATRPAALSRPEFGGCLGLPCFHCSPGAPGAHSSLPGALGTRHPLLRKLGAGLG